MVNGVARPGHTGARAPVLLNCAPATSTSILIIKLNVFTINVNYVIIVKWGVGTSLPYMSI